MPEHQPIQDDITIVLRAQKIIEHKEVRVNVAVSAQVDPATSENDFRSELQSTLKKFIAADWKLQSIQRAKGNRYETVTVYATARVPEAENYRLQERATEVSRIGFELVNPTVDYSLTFDEVQKINADLRATLVTDALTEVNTMNTIFKDAYVYVSARVTRPVYRVAHSVFQNGDQEGLVPLHLNQMAKAYSGSVSNTKDKGPFRALGATQAMMAQGPLGSGAPQTVEMGDFDDDDSADAPEALLDLNVSTRFSMTGTFTLRAFAAPYS